MIKILFVCHGNICRSPMAEYVMKDMVEKQGLSYMFEIESAATSREEIWNGVGNPVYPPAKRIMEAHGLFCDGHHARQVTKADYDKWDYIVLMDSENMWSIKRIIPSDPQGKISMMMDYTSRPGDVADPWYTGNFEATWRDVNEGCKGLLEHILKNKKQGK